MPERAEPTFSWEYVGASTPRYTRHNDRMVKLARECRREDERRRQEAELPFHRPNWDIPEVLEEIENSFRISMRDVGNEIFTLAERNINPPFIMQNVPVRWEQTRLFSWARPVAATLSQNPNRGRR